MGACSGAAAQDLPTFCATNINSQAALTWNGSLYCDFPGFIISPSAVIVPAHCVDGLTVQGLSVIAGDHNANPTPSSSPVSMYVMHENYNSFMGSSDIALVILANPLTFNAYISSVAPASVAPFYTDWIFANAGVPPGAPSHPELLSGNNAVVDCGSHGFCPLGQAPASIYLRGLQYTSSATRLCLSNLGTYNSANGAYQSSNFDPTQNGYVLNGKYSKTALLSLSPSITRFTSATNDFTQSSITETRESALHAAEAHLYYYINDYRSRFINDAFINSLSLGSSASDNLKYRQYKPDLQGLINARLPITTVQEVSSFTPWSNDVLRNDLTAPEKQRSLAGDPLDSFAFDPEWVVAQYAGQAAHWISAGTAAWPVNPTWGAINSSYTWRTDVRPAILQGFKLWAAYRYSGNSEVFRYAMQVHRRLNSSTCGAQNVPACDKGWNIDNAGMFLDTSDPVLNNPTNASWPAGASDDTLLFPFQVRSGVPANHGGPGIDGGLGGMYIAALFYDISKDVGLGDYKADQLFWKTVSLINPGQAVSMTSFGQLIQQAARALWPNPSAPGTTYYEQDLVDVLSARGIRMNGVNDFTLNLPSPLGSPSNPGPGTMTTASVVGVGSPVPDTQRNSSTGYNFLSFFLNGYSVSTAGTQYVTYQFYKHSKLGAVDAVEFTNGTINSISPTNPILNYDGQMNASYEGRSLGNMLLMAPGQTLRFLRRRQSAVSEQEGYYVEDVRPHGFRALKAIPNGFTFKVTKIGPSVRGTNYQLTIVDPSLTMSGANTGPATYAWTFTDYNGVVRNASGQAVTYDALANQPFTLSVTRTRGSQNDNITLRERGNDLDRNSGAQFNQNFVEVGYPVSFDTIINRRMVEGHGSYNSALNPVGGAFGVQGHRWTTPNQIVKPLSLSVVSHGIGSGSNQGGPYRFQDAVYYTACIWGARDNVTIYPGCHTSVVTGDFEMQAPFQQVGVNLGLPFAIVTAASYPAHRWTINFPSDWRLQPNTEYYFGGHISASVVNNGYSYNVCSYAQANWDTVTPGNAADRSDWLAGANWSGQSGAPSPQTMRSYLGQSGSVSNCTFAAYTFKGLTVPQ